MSKTGVLTMDAHGMLHGPANITHNSPWPCVNGDPGEMEVPRNVHGCVMHTIVGTYESAIEVFNRRGFDASAFFAVGPKGEIHQFGPVNGWKAWAEENGNGEWYSIEFSDNGNPLTPLNHAQLVAGAQLIECLSSKAVGNFPLQLADSPSAYGFGVHYMGGEAWGGHSCPDVPPRRVRSLQRPVILKMAAALRSPLRKGVEVKPGYFRYSADGRHSLEDVASILGVTAKHLHTVTVAKASPINATNRAKFIAYSARGWSANMPAGLVFYASTED